MKGGPTDPPNLTRSALSGEARDASMKGGPTDPPNPTSALDVAVHAERFNEGGAY